MKPISNIDYQIQYLTICYILDQQENIYNKAKKAYYTYHWYSFKFPQLSLDGTTDVFVPSDESPDCEALQALEIQNIQWTGESKSASARQALRNDGAVLMQNADLSLSQDVGKQVFGRCSWIFVLYTINAAHKQYSLLDTIFSYTFYFGPTGKHLYLSHQNPLHVSRRSRPTCSRFFMTCRVQWIENIQNTDHESSPWAIWSIRYNM